MLISPAEPHSFYSLGTVSSLPELLGVDFLTFSPTLGRIGIQRKEIKDLVASIGDRIPREIIAMKGLDIGIWMIEGNPSWSSDGLLLQTRTEYSWTQHQGLLCSLQLQGYWVVTTSSLTESMRWLSVFDKWAQKTDHTSLLSRRKQSGASVNPKFDKQVFVMQSFDGIGYGNAKAIVEHFGGLPMTLTEDLTEVKGIGKKTAERVKEMFE